jgi:hypothetical protein
VRRDGAIWGRALGADFQPLRVAEAQDRGEDDRVRRDIKVEIGRAVNEEGACASERAEREGAGKTRARAEAGLKCPQYEPENHRKKHDSARYAQFDRELQVVVVGVVEDVGKLHILEAREGVLKAAKANAEPRMGAK